MKVWVLDHLDVVKAAYTSRELLDEAFEYIDDDSGIRITECDIDPPNVGDRKVDAWQVVMSQNESFECRKVRSRPSLFKEAREPHPYYHGICAIVTDIDKDKAIERARELIKTIKK